MHKKLFLYLFFTCFFSVCAQREVSKLLPYKVGILYNNANEKNFWFDDADYFYTTNTLKAQAFYNLGTWKSFNFELIVQPQVQFLQHQLFNQHFVRPDQNIFLEKRKKFTQLKNFSLYALEFGLSAKVYIFKKTSFLITAGVGAGFIDVETERLAHGFTFIENGSLGLSYNLQKHTEIYFGGNIGHVSNFNFQLPNSGYNILGYEIGLQYSFD